MRFDLSNSKIQAGLKNFLNFNKSNCNNQTTVNLTVNIHVHPGGEEGNPGGQMEVEIEGVEGVEGVEVGQMEEGTSGEVTVGQGRHLAGLHGGLVDAKA